MYEPGTRQYRALPPPGTRSVTCSGPFSEIDVSTGTSLVNSAIAENGQHVRGTAVGARVEVGSGSGVVEAVAVGVGVAVGTLVGLGVRVGVRVGRTVGVAVGVEVGVEVAAEVRVGVEVAVAVGARSVWTAISVNAWATLVSTTSGACMREPPHATTTSITRIRPGMRVMPSP